MTWFTSHLLIIIAVLTGVREVLDVLPGESTPAGFLDAIVTLLKKLSGNSTPAVTAPTQASSVATSSNSTK